MSELEKIAREYIDLCHAMQSGVAGDIGTVGDADAGASPKHLRVGVNSALVNQAGLAKLLIDKGVITELEYFTAMRDHMRTEVERLEKLLTERLGKPVHLL